MWNLFANSYICSECLATSTFRGCLRGQRRTCQTCKSLNQETKWEVLFGVLEFYREETPIQAILPFRLTHSASFVQQSFVGAIAIADLVKTTLGPKGMDKILQSLGDEHARKAITVTNDGATILGSIYVDNPAAKILIDISKT